MKATETGKTQIGKQSDRQMHYNRKLIKRQNELLKERLQGHREAAAIVPDQNHLEQTAAKAKEAFYEGMESRPASYFEFLFQQSRYIQKRWWIYQFLILAALYFILYFNQSNGMLRRNAGVLAPVFIIFMMPELWKSRNSAMLEIESASYFSLRQIMAARMLLFAAADGLLLSAFTGLTVYTAAVGLGEIVLQFFLPMIVTCCICFRTLCSRVVSSETGAVFLTIIWTGIWEFILMRDSVYEAISAPVWIGICVLTVVYFIYVICKVMKDWGNYWEVRRTWN